LLYDSPNKESKATPLDSYTPSSSTNEKLDHLASIIQSSSNTKEKNTKKSLSETTPVFSEKTTDKVKENTEKIFEVSARKKNLSGVYILILKNPIRREEAKSILHCRFSEFAISAKCHTDGSLSGSNHRRWVYGEIAPFIGY